MAEVKVSDAQANVLAYYSIGFMSSASLLPGAWNPVAGQFSFSASDVAKGNTLLLYFQGPPAGTSFMLDDVAIVTCSPPTWRADAAARVEQVRFYNISFISFFVSGILYFVSVIES